MAHFFKNFPDPFETAVLAAWPVEERLSRRAVLAVSGGADSTALFTCFARIAHFKAKEGLLAVSEPLSAVHIDHRLRGAESDGDAAFVRDLAERYEIPFRLERLDPDELAAETKIEGSAESAARKLRYDRLRMAAEERGARYVLTAHHADDRLETLLIRLFRGSSFGGLTGIAPARPLGEAVALVRPFLAFHRKEIRAYLDRLGEPFRTDSSNASPRFTRNRVRNELIPLLESIFPNRWDGAMARLADRSAEIEPMIDRALLRLEKSLERVAPVRRPDGSLVIPLAPLLDAETAPADYLLREYFRRIWREKEWPLREMGTRQWEALAAMVRSTGSATREFPGGVTVRRLDDSLTLRKNER